MAEVLLHRPKVLILDEPTSGLDPTQKREMCELIRELGSDRTVLLSSHILSEVEATCNEIVIIAGGKLAARGSLNELRQRAVKDAEIIAECKVEDVDAACRAIQALDGVTDVQAQPQGNWTRLAIRPGGGADPRGAIHKLASEQGWALRELRTTALLQDFYERIVYETSTRSQRAG
jgi:ABC-2 type transport system ATP-binding protein